MPVARRIVFILFIFSLLAGAITGGNIFYRLSYLWIFLFLGGWLWARVSLQGVSIKRSARSLRAQVGQIFEERFDVQNNNRLPRLWLEIRDESNLPGSRGSRVLTLIRGREGRSYLVRTRLVQRGVYTLGPTAMTSGDIFGLFLKNNSTPALESLLVFPTMVNILNFPNPPGLAARWRGLAAPYNPDHSQRGRGARICPWGCTQPDSLAEHGAAR